MGKDNMNDKKKNFKKFYWVIPIVVLLIFQLNKRNTQIKDREVQVQLLEQTNSPYAKLLNQLPIYRDSVYNIYIANIQGSNKIVFIKKDSLSDVQRRSKFFIHIYPRDHGILAAQADHVAFNFKNNIKVFRYKGVQYFVSDTELPPYIIEKLNAGQYGYKGNNDINWKISGLLLGEKIGKILKENNEYTPIFEFERETF